VLKRGDITRVKLLSIDEKGRLRLSRKAALAEEVEGSSTDRAEGEDNIEVIED
jgi:predicted RNA-binding protein with RPS1 domain